MSSRGRFVVLDENEATRIFVSSALESAGYETVAVATTLGLKKALVPDRPTVVVCDVSPPLRRDQVVASIAAAHALTDGKARLILCGSQSGEELASLASTCGASGFVERRDDPLRLLQGVRRLLSTSRTPVLSSRFEGARTPQWAILKLLLIDDSEVSLALMQERLRGSGFDVRIALSLGEVTSIIQGWSPNVIVADVHMPDMRGDELCAWLKGTAATRSSLVMLCSSLPDDQLGELARTAGADAFVSKGRGLDHFVAAIEAQCRRLSNPVVSFE